MNNADTDDDGDGVNDSADAFLDATESTDTIATASAITPTPMTITTLYSIPTKSPPAPIHWIQTLGDSVNDNVDAFPLDATETPDIDGDGQAITPIPMTTVTGQRRGDAFPTQQKPLIPTAMAPATTPTMTMMAMVRTMALTLSSSTQQPDTDVMAQATTPHR